MWWRVANAAAWRVANAATLAIAIEFVSDLAARKVSCFHPVTAKRMLAWVVARVSG